MAVRNELDLLWKIEAKLRGIKFIEYNSHFKASPEKKDLALLREYLVPVFKEKYGANSNYYITQLERYFENKPNKKAFEEASDSLRHNAYRLAKPAEHVFSVVAL